MGGAEIAPRVAVTPAGPRASRRPPNESWPAPRSTPGAPRRRDPYFYLIRWASERAEVWMGRPPQPPLEECVLDLKRQVERLQGQIDQLVRDDPRAARRQLLSTLIAYLREHVAPLDEVDAVFLWTETEPLRIVVVVRDPGATEQELYDLLTKCLFSFPELDLDSTVLYRRNMPDLAPPAGALRITQEGCHG
ncbi:MULTISPECIES: hypothetical protein [Sorangium]|uniref:Uncharacterized protein n=1 Tax=Sorangium cellulosum TaxID=56 RepID=A0A4P2QVX7_SORCE|nr:MULTISPECIES: hypothetical protein [Sorangium]AUX34599.1 uncharacterized protein SOCE836_067750 [Sorangium cellulosum]WCQ93911.1 hypothetical protein NQZ70_06668 [Sorangium sp. Soce836]